MTTLDEVLFRDDRELPKDAVLELYTEAGWSSASKPDALLAGLAGSHSLVSAWHERRLIGLGNAITDGALVVYYPHLIVAKDWQRRGVGRGILERLKSRYEGFHQHAILAAGDAVGFYASCGFVRAGSTVGMWIYDGDEH